MGVAGSASRKSKSAPSAKDKRKKTQSQCVTTDYSSAATAKRNRAQSRSQRPLGPGTRPGSHQRLPITIDSDDEIESVVLLEVSASAAVRFEMSVDIEKEVVDETYIKIDFDDPDFMFDNDASEEPLAELDRQRRNRRIRPKKIARKPTAKASRPSTPICAASRSFPSSTGTYKASPTRTPTNSRTPGRTSTPCKGHVVERSKGKGVGDINRGTRATSYDLEFIVSDDEVLDESDETYLESDNGGASDIDMIDDGTDLCIDMEPECSTTLTSCRVRVPHSRSVSLVPCIGAFGW